MPEPQEKLKIVFASPCALLDPTSGAAQACRMMLEQMVARGHQAAAFTGTTFDRPMHGSAGEFLKAVGARPARQGDDLIGVCERLGVRHYLMRMEAQRRNRVTAFEESLYHASLKTALRQLKPDIVLSYGGLSGDKHMYRWLSESPAAPVFYLANEKYRDAEPFRDIRRIVTDSEATAALYAKRFGLDVTPLGAFIAPVSPSPPEGRRYCVYINPEPKKGVALFVAIARAAAKEGLDIPFRVVESRARLADYLARANIPESELSNVARLPPQPSMADVWRNTRVLLYPSFGHESASRSVVEALSAGIPSLATRSGGIEQMLAGGGFLFDLPMGDPAHFDDIPAPEQVQPWIETLRRLFLDSDAYTEASARAESAWRDHCFINDVERVEAVLQETVAAHRAASSARWE